MLVMFAHPRCPCSSASIGELATLMARCQGRLGAQVWFFQPAGETEEWARTDLWRSAATIPGVTVHVDSEGIEARRFNAETSGQVALYSQAGSLLFQGGITLSRGHSGDNPGSDAIEALLCHQFSGPVQTPVFGCALTDKKCLAAEGASKQP
ncbi:MAG: redB [Verrucomicrobiaceae bacterium]|nr:redB [Verrucomicrobiaceae bacterium]